MISSHGTQAQRWSKATSLSLVAVLLLVHAACLALVIVFCPAMFVVDKYQGGHCETRQQVQYSFFFLCLYMYSPLSAYLPILLLLSSSMFVLDKYKSGHCETRIALSSYLSVPVYISFNVILPIFLFLSFLTIHNGHSIFSLLSLTYSLEFIYPSIPHTMKYLFFFVFLSYSDYHRRPATPAAGSRVARTARLAAAWPRARGSGWPCQTS